MSSKNIGNREGCVETVSLTEAISIRSKRRRKLGVLDRPGQGMEWKRYVGGRL